MTIMYLYLDNNYFTDENSNIRKTRSRSKRNNMIFLKNILSKQLVNFFMYLPTSINIDIN